MDRLKRVPAWVVMAVLVAAVAAWAWWRSSKAKTDAEDQDQDDEEPARPNTMPASTAGLLAPMTYAQNGDQEDGTTSTTPPSLNRAQAAPAWLYGGNTATPADTYSTGHPTPVTYS